MNMADTIAPKSDQLNFDDLIAGPITITITGVRGLSDKDQPVGVSFEGDNGKPWKPCKSMRRVLVAMWGVEAQKYVGRSLTLFGDPKVRFGGIEVGGIRISHASHIDGKQTMALTVSRARRSPYTVDVLQVDAAPEASEELITKGQNASTQGTEALKLFWGSIGGANQKLLAGQLDGWKKAAAAIDEMSRGESEDEGGGDYEGA